MQGLCMSSPGGLRTYPDRLTRRGRWRHTRGRSRIAVDESGVGAVEGDTHRVQPTANTLLISSESVCDADECDGRTRWEVVAQAADVNEGANHARACRSTGADAALT